MRSVLMILLLAQATLLCGESKNGVRPTDPMLWEELTDEREYIEASDIEPEFGLEEEDIPDLSWFDTGIVRVILMIALGGLVLFALIRIIQAPGNRKLNSSEMLIEHIDAWNEDIQSLDLEQLLQQALSLGDLRLVLRVRYLMLLQSLDAMGWIEHHKDKTNGTYVRELSHRPVLPAFRKVTWQFERVWYGEHSLDPEDFARTEAEFERLRRELSMDNG